MFYSPLRYPGGKGKLEPFMELLIKQTGHQGGVYVEPFAGGAGIALELLEITEMTKDVTAGKIFVTAFLDFKTYKKFAEELAWETEVWIAEMPEHMIHLNGDRFMGPR